MRNFLISLFLLFTSMIANTFSYISNMHNEWCDISSANDHVEPLANFLFRYNIITANLDDKTISINQLGFLQNYSKLIWIWQRINDKPLQSPFNTYICYSDQYKSKIFDVKWVNTIDDSEYKNLNSLDDYLEKTADDISDKYHNGYTSISYTFAEIQQKQFLEKITIKGEKIHICGITQEIEELIITHLMNHLKYYKITPKHIFYFGSRVMPRSEVLKRDPRLIDIVPINEHGLNKNVVRISGLTKISDLEMMVIIPSRESISAEKLKEIKRQFKYEFAEVFREFPVQVNLMAVQNEASDVNIFNTIQATYAKIHHKHLSPYQFVELAF